MLSCLESGRPWARRHWLEECVGDRNVGRRGEEGRVEMH